MSDVDFTKDSLFPAQQAGFNSMRNVTAKNREGWLDLFAADALVQDPIGVSPLDPTGLGHHGREAIGAFWDKVIANNNGIFRIRESYPCANECANVLTLTQMLPNGKPFAVNFIGVYRIDDNGKIASLKAYWQFDKVMEDLAVQMAD
jgi:hypothetical protein